jgi:hypothetical protein
MEALNRDPKIWTTLDETTQRKMLDTALWNGMDSALIPDRMLQEPAIARTAAEWDSRVLGRLSAGQRQDPQIVQASIHGLSRQKDLTTWDQKRDAVVAGLRSDAARSPAGTRDWGADLQDARCPARG